MTINVAEAVVIERTFNAPVAKVWQALTDVDQMRQWYFDLKKFRPEVGFEFEFVVEHEGNSYHHLCKVTKVIPQNKWIDFSHQIIHHGRAICIARKPRCAECNLEKLCHAADKTWSTVEIHKSAKP